MCYDLKLLFKDQIRRSVLEWSIVPKNKIPCVQDIKIYF